jgi:hypothetical protein
MIWQVVPDVLEVFVHSLFFVLLYFHGLFVDHIYEYQLQHSRRLSPYPLNLSGTKSSRRKDSETDRRTDHSLGIIGARGSQTEFAQVVFRLLGEGVESGFRRLSMLALCKSIKKRCSYHGCETETLLLV